MSKTFQRIVTAVALTSLAGQLLAQPPFVLTDGTPLRVRLNRNLSSADANIGDTVDFEVLEDVLVNGLVVIQRGSTVLATVTEAKPKGRMGKAGKLNVNIDYARSVAGEKIALRAVKENQGSGSTGKMTGAMVATSIVFFPAAPLFLFMKGKDVTIPKGTEVTTYVHGEIRLDEERYHSQSVNAAVSGAGTTSPPLAPAAAVVASTASTPAAPAAGPVNSPPTQTSAPRPPAPPPSSGMSNSDVVGLKTAGFSDDLIISKIKSSRCAFRLEPSEMIELKKSGLSDRLISAMMEKAQ